MAHAAHIVPNGDLWEVKGDGIVLWRAQRQADAISRGRSWLKQVGGGELVIHGTDGAIRDKDTVAPGNDPRDIHG